MSKGLRSWVRANWVDIANRRPDGSFPKCGRSKCEKRKNYPKCVPLAKARAMSSGQRRAAVSRKRKLKEEQGKEKDLITQEHEEKNLEQEKCFKGCGFLSFL